MRVYEMCISMAEISSLLLDDWQREQGESRRGNDFFRKSVDGSW